MKRLIQSLVVAAGVAAVVVAFTLLGSLPKVAATSCSNSTLSATYGGYFWGSQNGTLDNSVPVISFNGTGGFSLSYWGMNGGSADSGTQTGDYTVNSNCEGTLYDSTSPYTTYDTFVVVSSASEVDFLNNASGANLSGVAKKQ
ncbi:MAG: hypothetical protein ACRD11_10750 [Terriglobia bacterium]